MASMDKDSLRHSMLQEDRLGQIEAIGSEPWFLAYRSITTALEKSVLTY